jgi:hypothetical protein
MNEWMNKKKSVGLFIHPSASPPPRGACLLPSLALFSPLARSLEALVYCRDRFLGVDPDPVMAGCSNNPRSGSISSATHDSLNWSPAPRIVCKSPHPPRLSVFFFPSPPPPPKISRRIVSATNQSCYVYVVDVLCRFRCCCYMFCVVNVV